MVKTFISFLLILLIPVLVFGARLDAYPNETTLNDADELILWDQDESAVNNTTIGTLYSHFNLGTAALLNTGTAIGTIPVYENDGSGNASLPLGEIYTEQGTDPTAVSMSAGEKIVSTASGDFFYKSDTGFYVIPGTYTAD